MKNLIRGGIFSFIILVFIITTAAFGQSVQPNPTGFLPKGYVVSEKIYGDLNKDGLEDCILIIKGTDKSKISKDEDGNKLDLNRRGIIILINKKENYELAIKNYNCFSSEDENEGGYLPPELFVETKKGNLFIHYGHGRYGYWKYTFRYRIGDFELIGFDSSENSGPIINSETSINFLTKKKLTKENTNLNPDQESGDEIFKETWENINVEKLVKLSEIKDFDEFEMSY